MSVFICSQETHIAITLLRLLGRGRGCSTEDVIEAANEVVTANVHSWSNRYNEDDTPERFYLDDRQIEFIWKHEFMACRRYFGSERKDPLAFIEADRRLAVASYFEKSLDCWTYQSCEGDDENTELMYRIIQECESGLVALYKSVIGIHKVASQYSDSGWDSVGDLTDWERASMRGETLEGEGK